MDNGRIGGHTVPINVIRFSLDGKYVASADDSGLLMVYNPWLVVSLARLIIRDTFRYTKQRGIGAQYAPSRLQLRSVHLPGTPAFLPCLSLDA